MISVEDAIYCMKAHLPGGTSEYCVNCKYYDFKLLPNGLSLCGNNEAYVMAIKALELLKEKK